MGTSGTTPRRNRERLALPATRGYVWCTTCQMVSSTKQQQECHERWIFRTFAKTSPLQIDLKSIEKREPPEPDIRCITKSTGGLNFELVELVDQEHAQRLSAQLEISDHFTQSYRNSAEALRRKLQSTLANACVVLDFSAESTIRRRRGSAQPVLERLAAIPTNFEGQLSSDDLGLPGGTAVRRVSILRGDYAGPCFENPTAGSLRDPAIELIGTKFRKQYRSEYPIELLAYYYRHPQITKASIPPELLAFLEESLPESSFRRVWVFSTVFGVLAVFPPLPAGR